MGSASSRNFTHTYSVLPVYPPTVLRTIPTTGASSVALNSQVIVDFSQAMDTATVQGAFSTSPSASGTFSWNSDNTKMTFTPSPNYSASAAYTVTINTNAKDSSGVPLSGNYIYSFTTGTRASDSAPAITFNPMTNNITTNITPTLTGTAEDGISSVVSVECRVDGGAWKAATPVNSRFSLSSEAFTFPVTSPFSRGRHTVEAKAVNSCGFESSSPYASYSFIVTGTSPAMEARFNGTSVMNNDSISSTPLIELTVLTASALDTSTVKLKIDGTYGSGVTTAKLTETTYLISYQVTSPLADGTHAVTAEGTDADGDLGTWSITGLMVSSSGSAQVQGSPLNFPNPFDPAAGTTFSYYLTKDSDVAINIYDMSGNLIARKTYLSAASGGKAGYNEVLWDCKSDSGRDIGNGMYLYLLIVDGKTAGKGKMTAFR